MQDSNILSLDENTQLSTRRVTNAYSYTMPSSISNFKPAPPAHRGVTAFQSSTSWRRYFEASKSTNKLIVVEFTATWCGPCRKMEQTIDEFASKYIDVSFVKIDVDKLFDVSCEYGVQTMPTFLLMKGGKMIDKITGARKDELQRKIENHAV